MIQRIQSVFLLAGILLLLAFILFPISHINLEDNTHIDFYTTGFKVVENVNTINTTQTIPLFSATLFSLVLSVVCIFLFKNRLLQLRICIYNILVLFLIIVLLIFYLITFKTNSPVSSLNYTIWLAIPLVNIILNILAYRSIRKDENLVKSYDRLR
jgi:hypothetical protein